MRKSRPLPMTPPPPTEWNDCEGVPRRYRLRIMNLKEQLYLCSYLMLQVKETVGFFSSMT